MVPRQEWDGGRQRHSRREGAWGGQGGGSRLTFNMFALIMIVRGLSSPLLLLASPLAICSPSILRSNDPEELTCAGLQATKHMPTRPDKKGQQSVVGIALNDTCYPSRSVGWHCSKG